MICVYNETSAMDVLSLPPHRFNYVQQFSLVGFIALFRFIWCSRSEWYWSACFPLSLLQYSLDIVLRGIRGKCNWEVKVEASINRCRTESVLESFEWFQCNFVPSEPNVTCEDSETFWFRRTVTNKSTIVVHKPQKGLDLKFCFVVEANSWLYLPYVDPKLHHLFEEYVWDT